MASDVTGPSGLAAVEMQFATLRGARLASQVAASITDPFVLEYLPGATPFFWSRDTTAAVWASAKRLPPETRLVPELLPEPVCWWWLEWPLPIPIKDASEGPAGLDVHHVCALLLARDIANGLTISDGRRLVSGQPGALMTGILSAPGPVSLAELLTQGACTWDVMSDQPEVPTARVLALHRFVVTACTWLQQQIVTVAAEPVERHRRKQLVREHLVWQAPADVKVVTFRA